MKKPRNTENPALVNPLECHLGYQLRRASVLLMTDLGTKLDPLGLRPTEIAVLLVIRANPGCPQGAIGDLLGVRPANMVPLIGGLVKQGLVDRARADGRSHALSLTLKGRTLTAAASKLLDRHDSEFQARLDGQSLSGLLAALVTLRG